MTTKAFIEKILNIKLFAHGTLQEKELGCFGFDCEGNGCDSCSHRGFWNKEINLPYVSKNVLNMLYGTEQTFVIGGRGNGRTCAIEHAIELQGWQRFPRVLDMYDFETIRDIVDEALDNGFEFKVYNSTLYYREKDYANTDSAQDVD